ARRERIGLTMLQVSDLMTYLIMGVVIGGRVGHVVFYEPHLLITFHSSLPWWGLLDIHKGGMSSHGGIIGSMIASVLFARRVRLPILHLFDCVAFVAPFGLCFGRLANWVNGELWGKPLPESMQANPPWWAVKYPAEIFESNFPVAKLAPLQSLVNPAEPLPEAVYRAAYLHRTDVLTKLEPLLTAYYPSNFIQAFTDGPILLLVMVIVWLNPRRPGVIAGVFLVTYGAARMTSEQFRQIDDGVFMIGSLTLPMLLSLAMIAGGIALIVWASRQAIKPIGGLLSHK
ncbi:MAG: prolipoprotein diacylglyceryl transferase, partial [Planctomycetota bacterium]|nr:prolipoprotein diacylglyceryl transferase [Planctomycetota bacterium]